MLNRVSWLALDIGGANLKLADGRGFAMSRPFPLWKSSRRLAAELAELLSAAPGAERIAVTMTGELADCFETKAEGVAYILRCAEQAAAGRHVRAYLVTGELVPAEEARRTPHLAAASNWHVLATFACQYLGGPSRAEPPRSPAAPAGLLIDIGSTTADIVPLCPEGPSSTCRSDVERLAARELVYTGVRRSPVCAVVESLPWRGGTCPIAREFFATTADTYVLLEKLPEDLNDRSTADGRPATRAAAHARIARMLCLDKDSLSYDEAILAAHAVREAQLQELRAALEEVVSAMPRTPATIVLSGEGEFLGRQLIREWSTEVPVVALSDMLGAQVSRAACAHALAALARNREEAPR